MSASGQKQTFAPQQVMSALHPKADKIKRPKFASSGLPSPARSSRSNRSPPPGSATREFSKYWPETFGKNFKFCGDTGHARDSATPKKRPTCGLSRTFWAPIKRERSWELGRQDSNLGMAESKSAALPLGYAPTGTGRAAAKRFRARRADHSGGALPDQCPQLPYYM
jgi:hypothetical protein